MVQTAHIATPSDHEIMMTHEFNAPRGLVFRAYTDPAHIPRWWGPREFTTIVDVMDVRIGGRWRYVLRDSEGNEFACHGEYLEIDPPHRLVSTFESEGMPGHIVTETMTLEERDGKTLLTTISQFTSIEDRDWMMTGVEADAPGMMDRLTEVIAELQKCQT